MPSVPDSGDLAEIRSAISETQSELQEKQAARQDAQRVLAKTQQALRRVQQDLAALNRQQREVWQSLQQLQSELEGLKTEVAGAKAQLARLLNSHYKNRQPNAVMLFLKNAEPGRKARYLAYARYINQANRQVIETLSAQQAELVAREAQIDAELARLDELKKRKQASLRQLGQSNSQAQVESRRLTQQIDAHNRKLKQLRADESRLNQILADITKRNADKRRQQALAREKAAKARLEAAKRHAQSEGKAKAKKSKPTSTLTAEDRALAAPYEQGGSRFSLLQGRLNPPVGGSLSGRFGQAKPDGGHWRGLFYATSGATVRNIAAGTVAFAGTLGGYGNTVVVDHGDGYTSIYTGLASIEVSGDQVVSGGQSLGQSGGLSDGQRGLYFELRYRTTPINPLSWLR